MVEHVLEVIDKVSSGHVLKGAPGDYLREFAAAVCRVYPNRVDEILRNKFGVCDCGEVCSEAYLQYAAELSVQNHLMLQPTVTGATPEKEVHPPKDVDAVYVANRVNVALDVKCPVEPADPASTVVMRSAGRVPKYGEIVHGMRDVLQSDDPSCTVELAKNKDNTLKDFLLDAHAKFSPNSGVSDLNVLLIACGDHSSLQNWHTYLMGEQGLFTRGSFHPPAEYNLVDVVVLSSLKYCHSGGRPWHRWTLDDCFLLPVPNPAPRKTLLYGSVIEGLGIFTHHMKRFGSFTPLHEPGVPDYIVDRVKLTYYIKGARGLTDAERERYFPAGLELNQSGRGSETVS